nr:transporter substrate-binding domain-containing protein [uncultured Pseudodesulfovibrio sp.]
MNCKLFILTVLFTTVTWIGTGFWTGCIQAEAADKTITMFIPDTNWPPYIMDDPYLPDGGVFVEVLRAVAEPLDYKIKVMRLPNRRGWMMLEHGKIDVHPKAMKWVPNATDFLWTDPFMQSEDVLIYAAETPLKYTSPKDLYGKSVATIKDFAYPVLEPHFGPNKIRRVRSVSPYSMLGLLAIGRVDAAVVNRAETQWLMRTKPELSPERFVLDETPCDSADYRFAFTKKGNWEPFIQKFNTVLNAMKQDGRLEAILNKYR